MGGKGERLLVHCKVLISYAQTHFIYTLISCVTKNNQTRNHQIPNTQPTISYTTSAAPSLADRIFTSYPISPWTIVAICK